MLRFEDRNGVSWDVVVGRESWGALLALFVRADGHEIRQAPLRADDVLHAEQELDALLRDELQTLLDRAELKMDSEE